MEQEILCISTPAPEYAKIKRECMMQNLGVSPVVSEGYIHAFYLHRYVNVIFCICSAYDENLQ